MDLPKTVGVMILPSVNLFPQAILPLFILEPRYRRMLKDSLDSHRMFCVAMQKPGDNREAPSAVAGIGLIRAAVENPDGTSNMILQGVARVSLGRVVRYRPYRVQSVQPLTSKVTDSTAIDALAAKVRELVGERFRQGLPGPLKFLTEGAAAKSGVPAESISVEHILKSLGDVDDPSVLADLVSCTLLGDPRQRQVLLETVEIEARLRYLICFLLADLQHGRKSSPG